MATPKDKRRNYADKMFEPFAISLGRITLAWNSFHVELSEIFWVATGYANGMIPGVIWNAIKVDRAQRDILRDFTNSKAIGINLSSDVRREINWILNAADKLENTRNNFVHTTFGIDAGRLFALHLGQHKRGLTFTGRDPQAKADWIFEQVTLLSVYAEKLTEVIRRPDQPLPRRPLLPNRPDPNGT